MRALTSLLFPIHPDGYKFIGVFAALTLLLYFISDFLGNAGLVLTLWCAWFFRDPARTTQQRSGLVISPADGVVNMITDAVPPPTAPGKPPTRLAHHTSVEQHPAVQRYK